VLVGVLWKSHLNFFIAISQNHRLAEVGRNLLGSSHPTPAQGRLTYSRLLSTVSRQGLNISRGGESTTSLGRLCQLLITLTVIMFFLMFKWNFLHLNLCPWRLVLSLGTTEKASSSLLPPHQVFIHVGKIPLSLFFSRLNSPSSLSLSAYERCPGPLIIFMAIHWSSSSMSTSLFYWGAQKRTQHPRCVSAGLSRGQGTPPVTCWPCST